MLGINRFLGPENQVVQAWQSGDQTSLKSLCNWTPDRSDSSQLRNYGNASEQMPGLVRCIARCCLLADGLPSEEASSYRQSAESDVVAVFPDCDSGRVVSDLIKRLQGRRQSTVAASERCVQTPVFFAETSSNGGALVYRLSVSRIDDGGHGLFPDLAAMGATVCDAVLQNSLLRMWTLAGIRGFRGLWSLTPWTSGSGVLDREPNYELALPALTGPSLEVAALCAFWALRGGIPGDHAFQSSEPLPLDNSCGVTGVVSDLTDTATDELPGSYRIERVSYTDRKIQAASKEGLESLLIAPPKQGTAEDLPTDQQHNVRIVTCQTARDAFERLLRCNRHQQAYSEHLAAAWRKQWATSEDVAENSRLAPWIEDHSWSILTDHGDLKRALDRRNFRVRAGDAGIEEAFADKWRLLDKHEFAANGRANPRVVFTTDAGLGKSKALEWLEFEFNRPNTDVLAFRLTLPELEQKIPELQVREQDFDQALQGWLVGKLRTAAGPDRCSKTEAQLLVERARRQHLRLVLLIDGLDHATSVDRLRHILSSPWWTHVRWILAGRPYSLQLHFNALGLQQGWQFVRLEEFNESQQRRYLGVLPTGESRFERLPEMARSVLSIPRVLYYLRFKVSPDDFSKIRTSADVFWQAIHELIVEGMKNSAKARMLGWSGPTPPIGIDESQLQSCYHLLAAIAYTMTEDRQDQIPRKRLEGFWRRLAPRYSSAARDGLVQDTQALAALNDILEHGLFDTDIEGLQELQFRDKSLREFLTAYHLAHHADRSTAEFWWQRGVYQPIRPESEDDYYVWQFLCEMHRDALLEEHWLEAIEPLYRPGCQNKDSNSGSWSARRSCEMIYRSWPRLQELCRDQVPQTRNRAREILGLWQGEFKTILLGEQGTERQQAAQSLKEDLLLIPGGSYQMGAPREMRPGIPNLWKALLVPWYQDVPKGRANWGAHIERVLSRLNLGIGKAAQQLRTDWTALLNTLAGCTTVESMLEEFEQSVYPWNETPLHANLTIPDFKIGRSPVLNCWFRLFVPDHGFGEEYPQYKHYSSSLAHPAIYVDWFHAWCFSRWLYWDGHACRLPWEQEWEYVAKYRNPWDWPYWWGTEWADGEGKITAQGHIAVNATTIPTPKHSSPATQAVDNRQRGVMDLLGNVAEWCADVYRSKHQHSVGDDDGGLMDCRVVRGGSFQGDSYYARCSTRGRLDPSGSKLYSGCRVARADF
jgi:formylglycine-generating enzyme required for sulfatase activity